MKENEQEHVVLGPGNYLERLTVTISFFLALTLLLRSSLLTICDIYAIYFLSFFYILFMFTLHES